jgi:microcompartment protein CcmK/EutM
MILARIIGTVVATRKDPRLEGKKLMICRPLDPDGNTEKGYVVAVDTVDAESVNRSRSLLAVRHEWYRVGGTPVDSAIVGIVDQLQD